MNKEHRKIQLKPQGLPYPGGVVRGSTVYFPNGVAISKAAVTVREKIPASFVLDEWTQAQLKRALKGSAKGGEKSKPTKPVTLKDHVLRRWK
jgi:hypothetical protein